MECLTTLEKQIEKNRIAAEENPDDVGILLSYAQCCLRRDLRLEALKTFQKVLQIEKKAEAYLSLAKIFAWQSHYQEAFDELRSLFEMDQMNVQGHILLHLLSDKTEIPDDLKLRLSFVPSRELLAQQYIKLESERDIMIREVVEYQSLVSGDPAPEPLMLYYIEEAKKRVQRVLDAIAKCDEWDRKAVALPGSEHEEKLNHLSETHDLDSLISAVKTNSFVEIQPELSQEAPQVVEHAEEYKHILEHLVGQRGIEKAVLISKDSRMLALAGELGNMMELIAAVIDGFESLKLLGSPLCWSLECDSGMTIVEEVDDNKILVVDCASGNLAVLRNIVDKSAAEIAAVK